MPMVPEEATASAWPSRHAAKRKSARVALVVVSDDDSTWKPVQAVHRLPRPLSRVPDEEAASVAESVLRNRITQRHYLQRKKVLPATSIQSKQIISCSHDQLLKETF